MSEAGRRRQPSGARERWNPAGARRHGWLEAQQDSAADQTSIAGDAQNQRLLRATQSSDAKSRITATPMTAETRVAVLGDCDNAPLDILDHTLRMVARFSRVVLRRDYGNQGRLTKKWQDALVAWLSRPICSTSTPPARTPPTSPWRWKRF